MSKYSKIIAGGCSFTDKDFPKFASPNPLDYKMWPEVIGEKLDCEVINTGRCGFGNYAIYHTTLNAIMKHKVDHVFVMWSDWTRQDFLIDSFASSTRMSGKAGGDYVSLHPFYWGIKESDVIKWYNESFTKNFPHKHIHGKEFTASMPNIQQLIDTNINYIFSMQAICEKLNIKYTACQAMENDRFLPSILIKHPYLEHIKNFYGWPMDKKLGGFTMVDLLKKEYKNAYKVSEEDAHPNEIGHKFIGNKIMEYINV
tara:strand:- start:976 stop:1743 length:768 start_codon:yes stop_codon:yes gene_type:complete